MKKIRIILVVFVGLALMSAVSAVGPITFPYSGTLTVTYIGSNTGYNDLFGIDQPYQKSLGFTKSPETVPGTVFTIGLYTTDDPVVLYIVSPPEDGSRTYYSDQLGEDLVNHAFVSERDGVYTVGFEDMLNGGDKDYNDVIITVQCDRLGPNQPPIFDTIENKIVTVGQTLSFTLSANDPDSGDVLTYSYTPILSDATLDPSTGEFSWTPSAGYVGVHYITFTVTDNGNPGLSDSEMITINVIQSSQLAVAAFEATPTSGGVPLKVIFTDKSNGDEITSRMWQYKLNSDNTWTSLTLDETSSYKFKKAGSYDIKLTVIGTGGSDDEVKSNYINAGCDFSTTTYLNRCFGGVGIQCEGIKILKVIKIAPFKQDKNTCTVSGVMSAGSIVHDRCCIDTMNTGYLCHLTNLFTTKCLGEWNEAVDDAACGKNRQWDSSFGPYYYGNVGDNVAVEVKAPAGVRVNPIYKKVCPSGKCRANSAGVDRCGFYCICE